MARMEFQHHPLVKWPRAETPKEQRQNAQFKNQLRDTLPKLAYELSRIGAINPILITTAHAGSKDIRIDGLPREDVPAPKFPGVIIEFYAQLKGKAGPREKMQYACDRYRKWQHNLHSITVTLQALRAVDRYGATAAGEQYIGFKALPGPAQMMSVDEAARMLASMRGVGATAAMIIDQPSTFGLAYKAAAKHAHPDAAGESQTWKALQQAAEVLKAHHHA